MKLKSIILDWVYPFSTTFFKYIYERSEMVNGHGS